MTFSCPACQRSFGEPGFCPYDGKPLVKLDVAQKPTIVSEFMAAQSPPITLNEPDTLLPSQMESATNDPTNQVVAMSAMRTRTAAIDTLRDQESEYDQLVGETLDGRYYVERKIGEGGMGVVFAAKHAVIERPLAIKVLKREVMRDTATIKRFVQEAKAASRIGHPNIVDVTDFGTTPDGMTYSVMEYVDGSTLSKAIKEYSPFPPERAIRIATQIARALGAAHDKGIVHRDLKPENVFLIDRDERPDFVKIVDFGIAKVQPLEGAASGPRLTRAGSVFGTPEYMAPEQAAGRSDTDGRVDIYALGTILYEMIVGRTPHKGDSMIRTIAMQMLDPIVPPSKVQPDLGVLPALEDVIMKALAKKREERYQTMGDLIVALDDVTMKLAALSTPPATPAPTLSLPPLPPGADPSTTPSLPPATLRSSDVPTGPPRRSKPETRPLHEPEFVVAAGSVMLPPAPEMLDEPEHRRWPWAVLALVLVGGATAALWIAMRADKAEVAIAHDAGTHGDANLVAVLHDADVPPDDAELVTGLNPDGGARSARRDAGTVEVTPGNHPKDITVEVLVRPGDAGVFVGRTYRGPNSVHLTEPYGTRLTIECHAPHFKKGTVKVVFDGSRDSVMCTAIRLKPCPNGLKSFNDDCEVDPLQSP